MLLRMRPSATAPRLCSMALAMHSSLNLGPAGFVVDRSTPDIGSLLVSLSKFAPLPLQVPSVKGCLPLASCSGLFGRVVHGLRLSQKRNAICSRTLLAGPPGPYLWVPLPCRYHLPSLSTHLSVFFALLW